MSKSIKLSSVVKYSSKRINVDEISVEDFISTDNLLQNKLGKENAIKLPSSKGLMPSYSNENILVGNIRPYLRKIWFADKESGCSADVLVFDVNKFHYPKFIYYTLFRDDFFDHMMKGSKGTKMPRGDKKQILDFLIPDFEFKEQQKITKVLSDLDAKIELNNRINAELEAMAKTLYDYWFVQFDFPDAIGKPYKTSGGKMVWNEELKRDIPEGWESGVLSDIANITMGQSPPGESYNEEGDGMIFYQGCTDFGNRYPTIRKFTTSPTRFAKHGDILLSVRAPVGTLNISKEDCCIGRGLACLNSKNDAITYLFGVMVNLKQTFDRRNVSGTTFGSITKDDLFSLPVIIPNEKTVRAFQNLVFPAFEKQNKIELENIELASLRDWLLPMLMNGQVSVGDVAEELGMVAEEREIYEVKKN
jgi:type I restriction enzyme S subunit